MFKDSVKDSDLIIISTPLSSYKEILLSIKRLLKKRCISNRYWISKKRNQ